MPKITTRPRANESEIGRGFRAKRGREQYAQRAVSYSVKPRATLG